MAKVYEKPGCQVYQVRNDVMVFVFVYVFADMKNCRVKKILFVFLHVFADMKICRVNLFFIFYKSLFSYLLFLMGNYLLL